MLGGGAGSKGGVDQLRATYTYTCMYIAPGVYLELTPATPADAGGPSPGAEAYPYMEDLLRIDACRPMQAVRLPERLGRINTPLSWSEWDRALASHPDQRFRQYIVEGIRYGFRVGFDYQTPIASSQHNMPSARERPEVVSGYLAEECSQGRVLGPLEPAMFPQVHTSRFGVIPKGSSGKWRLILDMSSPEGRSVNDGINEALCSLTYVGVEDAVKGIKERGKGALLAKVDIKSAYRNIPVHPDDRWLMGMKWDRSLFIDTTLPFGMRSAPKIFTAVADAVEWIARKEGVRFIIHYLDDYLVIGAPASEECAIALEKLLGIFRRLGLPVAWNKREGPDTLLEFLGFELDTEALQIRLPPAKLEELVTLVQGWQAKKATTRTELESLIGKLGHAARKTFMRRMFALKATVRRPYHRVRLNKDFHSDLAWWAMYLGIWNGVGMMRGVDDSPTQHQIWTDASGTFGCGAWDPEFREWIQVAWPATYSEGALRLSEESIALKELLLIVIACGIWGGRWSKSRVTVYCDNEGVVAMVNSGYSRVPPIMHLLRTLFFIRAHFYIDVWAVHVPGANNELADAISRDNLRLLFSQVPEASHRRVAVPPPLLALLVEQQPDWTSPTWRQLFGSCFLPAWHPPLRGATGQGPSSTSSSAVGWGSHPHFQ